jgi:hypothetical protein
MNCCQLGYIVSLFLPLNVEKEKSQNLVTFLPYFKIYAYLLICLFFLDYFREFSPSDSPSYGCASVKL